jgi:hypothetical protein
MCVRGYVCTSYTLLVMLCMQAFCRQGRVLLNQPPPTTPNMAQCVAHPPPNTHAASHTSAAGRAAPRNHASTPMCLAHPQPNNNNHTCCGSLNLTPKWSQDRAPCSVLQAQQPLKTSHTEAPGPAQTHAMQSHMGRAQAHLLQKNFFLFINALTVPPSRTRLDPAARRSHSKRGLYKPPHTPGPNHKHNRAQTSQVPM